ncbi:MAG: peptidase domain-containing protein [Methanoregula sp.]|jgi:hypothetical protein|nr:peptidase domain-containing protein [Methanoregula sp.]
MFLRDTMKVHWLVLLIVVGVALVAPAVSAQVVEEKDGYVVTLVNDPLSLPGTARLATTSYSLSQGQTMTFLTYVPSGYTAFITDLNWGVPANSLSLTIVAPDSTLGPYYDSSDGVINGRITLRISKASGLASGTWSSFVYGQSVSGSQSFTYSAALS